jgi:hypothetical protein
MLEALQLRRSREESGRGLRGLRGLPQSKDASRTEGSQGRSAGFRMVHAPVKRRLLSAHSIRSRESKSRTPESLANQETPNSTVVVPGRQQQRPVNRADRSSELETRPRQRQPASANSKCPRIKSQRSSGKFVCSSIGNACSEIGSEQRPKDFRQMNCGPGPMSRASSSMRSVCAPIGVRRRPTNSMFWRNQCVNGQRLRTHDAQRSFASSHPVASGQTSGRRWNAALRRLAIEKTGPERRETRKQIV